MNIISQYFSDIQGCIDNFSINVESIQPSPSSDLLYTHAITEHKKLLLALPLYPEEEIDKHQSTRTLYDRKRYLRFCSELLPSPQAPGPSDRNTSLGAYHEINRYLRRMRTVSPFISAEIFTSAEAKGAPPLPYRSYAG
jgi:hypothetical protein